MDIFSNEAQKTEYLSDILSTICQAQVGCRARKICCEGKSL